MPTPAKAQPKLAQPTSTEADDETASDPTPEELAAYREYVTRNASPEAQTMLAQGAGPVSADVQTLIDRMQAQISSLMTERGVPADPVEAASKNLWDHVAVRASAMPHVDFTELKEELSNDSPSHELVELLIDELPKHPELAYLGQLARDYRKTVVKTKAGK
jgi:predicted flavoprotein YhiN